MRGALRDQTVAEDTSLSRAFSFWVWLALVIRKRSELLSCQSRMTFVIDVFFGLVIFNIVRCLVGIHDARDKFGQNGKVSE